MPTTIGVDREGRLAAFNDAGEILMVDAEDEVGPYANFVAGANGRVLLLGLGLGIMASMLLSAPLVTGVVGVEIDPILCAYVSGKLPDPRLTVVCADCWEWEPVGTFVCGYYSIWHWRNLDTWAEKESLKHRYAPVVTDQHVDWEDVLDEWMRLDMVARNVNI